MEEALRVITISQSCPVDQLFVFHVRLQLLKQKADDIRQQDETDYARTGATPASSAPRLLYIKTLRRQLNELMSSRPPDLLQLGKLFLSQKYWQILTTCRHSQHTRAIRRIIH